MEQQQAVIESESFTTMPSLPAPKCAFKPRVEIFLLLLTPKKKTFLHFSLSRRARALFGLLSEQSRLERRSSSRIIIVNQNGGLGVTDIACELGRMLLKSNFLHNLAQ